MLYYNNKFLEENIHKKKSLDRWGWDNFLSQICTSTIYAFKTSILSTKGGICSDVLVMLTEWCLARVDLDSSIMDLDDEHRCKFVNFTMLTLWKKVS